MEGGNILGEPYPTIDRRGLQWSSSVGSVATGGVFLKARLHEGGEDYYLKMSNYDIYRGVFGHEAVNEVIAYRLAGILGIDAAESVLEKALVSVDGAEFTTYVSKSKSFKATGDSRVSFETYYVNNRLSAAESPLEFCERAGWSQSTYKMFVFDFLIINRDRHGANLEIIKNATGIRMSPLFDNGVSFHFMAQSENDYSNFDILFDYPVNNFIGSRSLYTNLGFIKSPVTLSRNLGSADRGAVFEGIGNILSKLHIDLIWEIIWKRFDHVKKICDIGFRQPQ